MPSFLFRFSPGVVCFSALCLCVYVETPPFSGFHNLSILFFQLINSLYLHGQAVGFPATFADRVPFVLPFLFLDKLGYRTIAFPHPTQSPREELMCAVPASSPPTYFYPLPPNTPLPPFASDSSPKFLFSRDTIERRGKHLIHSSCRYFPLEYLCSSSVVGLYMSLCFIFPET